MSYGKPCNSTTGVPCAGPSSTYPTLRTPARSWRTGPNVTSLDEWVGYGAAAAGSLLTIGATPAASAAPPVVRKNWRRLWLWGLLLVVITSPFWSPATARSPPHSPDRLPHRAGETHGPTWPPAHGPRTTGISQTRLPVRAFAAASRSQGTHGCGARQW